MYNNPVSSPILTRAVITNILGMSDDPMHYRIIKLSRLPRFLALQNFRKIPVATRQVCNGRRGCLSDTHRFMFFPSRWNRTWST